MEESVTYQKILRTGQAKGRDEGKTEEAEAILLRQGRKKLDALDESIQAVIQSIPSVEKLEELSERLLDVASLDELLVGAA